MRDIYFLFVLIVLQQIKCNYNTTITEACRPLYFADWQVRRVNIARTNHVTVK